MFQPNLYFEANSYNTSSRKRALFRRIRLNKRSQRGIRRIQNLSALAEGEEVTATFLGRLQGGVLIFIRFLLYKKIHRVPSVEEATASFSGNLILTCINKKLYRKNAPNELFLIFNNKKEETHGA